MKTFAISVALIAGLGLAPAALAQTAPTGGADAKGNAPVKPTHTINDGAAKPAANSFTENEARKHIANSGYGSVSGLMKGKDGIWRGTATKDGVAKSVALDFKGNVTDAGPSAVGVTNGARMASTAAGASAPTPRAEASAASSSMHQVAKHRRHRSSRHGGPSHCTTTTSPNGVACSGVDRNRNSVSDKEDKAIKSGAKP